MTASPLDGTARPDPDSPAVDPAGSPETWANPGGAFLPLFVLAAVGAGMAQLVPLVLTVPIKATLIDRDGATGIVAVVAGLASLASLIAFPALGRLSDRTTSRLGRRRPFLLVGAVLWAIGGLLLAVASGTAGLVLAGVVSSVGFSATAVALIAIIPDQFAPHRRGTVSTVIGLSAPVGAVVGLFVAQLVAPNLTLMILLPAAVAVLGSGLLGLVMHDPQVTDVDRSRSSLRQVLATYWVSPRRHPSFAWTWLSRLLIYAGVAAIQAYQAFYLIRVLGIPEEQVAGAIFLTTLVLTGTALVAAPVAARISDRIGRRKPFVIGSAVVFAVGLALAAFTTTYGSFLIAMVVIGAGQGVYFAVDVALMTQVLPDPENPANDLGIMNLANGLPPALVPAIAPVILLIGATTAVPQNYSALFLFGAIAALIGAAVVLPVRKAR